MAHVSVQNLGIVALVAVVALSVVYRALALSLCDANLELSQRVYFVQLVTVPALALSVVE